jgi:hypothetical protein
MWRRTIGRAAVGLVILSGPAGCRTRAAVDLEAARVLEGDWLLTLRGVPGLAQPDTAVEVSGTVAMLANRSGVRVSDFSGVPLNVGVHDLRLGTLAPGLAPSGVPDVVGSVAGDSALLVIGPGARQPIQLHGAYTPDSIAGRWTAYQRAGFSAAGTFVMRRR